MDKNNGKRMNKNKKEMSKKRVTIYYFTLGTQNVMIGTKREREKGEREI